MANLFFSRITSLLSWCCIALCFQSVALSAPTIEIKGEADIRVDPLVPQKNDRLFISGQIFEVATQQGIPNLVLSLQSPGSSPMTWRTDSDGLFRFDIVKPESMHLSITYEGDNSYSPASSIISLPSPPPTQLVPPKNDQEIHPNKNLNGVAWSVFLITFIAALLLIGSKMRADKRQRTAHLAAETKSKPDPPSKPGIQRQVAPRKRQQPSIISGWIRDSAHHRLVPNVKINLKLGTSIEHAVTDEKGFFQFEDIPEGDHHLTLSHPQYSPLSQSITCPHPQGNQHLTIFVESLREHVFRLYRQVAEPLLPSPDLWGRWTPRQLLNHLGQADDAKLLKPITDEVEQLYFGKKPPTVDSLHHLTMLIAESVSENSISS